MDAHARNEQPDQSQPKTAQALSDTDREIADPAYRPSEGPTPQRVSKAAAGLRIYDSRTHEVSLFTPLTPGQVRIYVCGATVQSAPHIGHMRAAVAFDVIRRWMLRLGYDVVFVRNVTDIDDKILAKAAAAHQQWWARAYHYERVFTRAYRLLGVIPPTYEPRATGHMPEMIDLVNRLIARGHAYVLKDGSGRPTGNVFFDVRSWPEYGALTHQTSGTREAAEREDQDARTADAMAPSVDRAGADKYNPEDPTEAEFAALKHDPRDFALWKAAKANEPASAAWDAPFGKGRPGWHLECSAMSHRYLGDSFDIHGGGLDLRFPHHENEMAQSRAAGWGFAQHWMHSAWVTAKGEKMSKSLGNGLSVEAVLSQHSAWVARYALASVHYRAMLEWGPKTLSDAESAHRRIVRFVQSAARFTGSQPGRQTVTAVGADELPQAFRDAMNNDFAVSDAFAVIFQTIRSANSVMNAGTGAGNGVATGSAAEAGSDGNALDAARRSVARDLLSVRAMLDVFGLDPLSPVWAASPHGQADATAAAGQAGTTGADAATGSSVSASVLDNLVSAQLEARQKARKARDFVTADAIRDQLSAAGIAIEDTPDGPRWSLKR